MKLISPFTFSQSSLQDYTDCPRRFYLRYIDHLQWPAVGAEPVLENERSQKDGQWFHRMVQQHLLGIPVDKLSQLAVSPNLKSWWQSYLAHPLQSLDKCTRYTELVLSTPLGDGHRLVAKYDLVAIRSGSEALIVDWKTNAKRPRDERMSTRWQTRVYRALLVQAGAHLNGGAAWLPEQVRMIYWYANYPSDPAIFPYSSSQFQHDQEALLRLVNEISVLADFQKTEDEQKCAYCVYRSYCERGVSAGLVDELDDEPDEPTINMEQIQEIAY